MNRQFSEIDLIASIQKKINEKTSLTCYDHVEDSTPSPLVFAELVRTNPANTKTTYRTTYTVWLHIISEETDSSVPVLKYIKEVEEALTEDIEVPESFWLVNQTNEGIQIIKKDESGEKHAVLQFSFLISYGFKTK